LFAQNPGLNPTTQNGNLRVVTMHDLQQLAEELRQAVARMRETEAEDTERKLKVIVEMRRMLSQAQELLANQPD
jgi:ribosome recycling factor